MIKVILCTFGNQPQPRDWLPYIQKMLQVQQMK